MDLCGLHLHNVKCTKVFKIWLFLILLSRQNDTSLKNFRRCIDVTTERLSNPSDGQKYRLDLVYEKISVCEYMNVKLCQQLFLILGLIVV